MNNTSRLGPKFICNILFDSATNQLAPGDSSKHGSIELSITFALQLLVLKNNYCLWIQPGSKPISLWTDLTSADLSQFI